MEVGVEICFSVNWDQLFPPLILLGRLSAKVQAVLFYLICSHLGKQTQIKALLLQTFPLNFSGELFTGKIQLSDLVSGPFLSNPQKGCGVLFISTILYDLYPF